MQMYSCFSISTFIFLCFVSIPLCCSSPLGKSCTQSSASTVCQHFACINSTCQCCHQDSDCFISDSEYWSSVRICQSSSEESQCSKVCAHKDLTPFGLSDAVMTGLVTFSVVLASSAGIGGGGMLVPIFLIAGGFVVDHASPLSSATISGSAIANFIIYSRRWHPDYPSVQLPLIQYNIALVICPPLLAGTFLGSILDKVLPLWAITISLFVLLLFLSYRIVSKALERFRGEQRQIGKSSVVNSSEILYTNKWMARFPPKPLVLTMTAWLLLLTVGLIKGGSGVPSIVKDVKCGNKYYWMTIAFGVTSLLLLTAYVVFEGLKLHMSEDLSAPLIRQSKFYLTPRQSLLFPPICLICGIAAGLLGVGGGMIVGPLLVEIGLPSTCVAATSAFTVLITSTAASLQFIIMGYLYKYYAIFFASLGFVATLCGQIIIDKFIKKYNKSSIIIFIMGIVILIATGLLGYSSVQQLVIDREQHVSMGFRPLCT